MCLRTLLQAEAYSAVEKEFVVILHRGIPDRHRTLRCLQEKEIFSEAGYIYRRVLAAEVAFM